MESQNVTDYMDKLEFGRFHLLAMVSLSLRIFARGSVGSLVSILEPFLRCHWNLSFIGAALIVLPASLTRLPGSIFIGWLADKYGRKRAMVLLFAMCSFLSVLSSMSNDILRISIIRAGLGLFDPNISIVHIYLMEILPISKRKYMSFLKLSYFLGSFYGIIAGILTLRYLNWRWFNAVTEAVPFAVCTYLVYLLPESPRYLVAAGRQREAEAAMEKILEMNENDTRCTRKLDSDEKLLPSEPTKKNVSETKHSPFSKAELALRIGTISVFRFVCILMGTVMHYGTMQFAENSDEIECGKCAQSLTYVYRWSMELGLLFSLGFSFVILGKLNRKTAFRVLLILLFLNLVPFYWDLRQWPMIVSTFFICTSVAVTNMLCNVYQAEWLPTSVRAFGVGIVDATGHVGVFIGTLIALYLYHVNLYLSLGILHGFLAIGLVVAFTLISETKDISLRDK